MKKKNIIKLEERINNIEKLAKGDADNNKLPKAIMDDLALVFTGMRFSLGLLDEDKLMNEDDKIIAESIVTGTVIVKSAAAISSLISTVADKIKDDDDE